jgi:hypothetical protein
MTPYCVPAYSVYTLLRTVNPAGMQRVKSVMCADLNYMVTVSQYVVRIGVKPIEDDHWGYGLALFLVP